MPDQEMEKDRWPRLTLEFNNALHHYQDMDPEDGFEHDPASYETYVPLSELEAEQGKAEQLRAALFDMGIALGSETDDDGRLLAHDATPDEAVRSLIQRAEAAEKALKEAVDAEALLGDRAINAVCEVLDDEAADRTGGEAVTDYILAKRLLKAVLAALATHNDNEEDPNA